MSNNLFFWVLRLKAPRRFHVSGVHNCVRFLFFFFFSAVSYGTRTLVIAGKSHKILIQILNAVTRYRIGSSCEAQSWFCSKHWISLWTCRRDTVFFAGKWAKVSGKTNSNHKQFSIPSLFFFKFSCLICNNNVSIQQEI